LLGAFLLFASLGFLYSPHPGVVWKGLLQVTSAALLYFLLLHAARSVSELKLLCGAFVAGGVLTSVVGIAHYIEMGGAGTKTWGNPNTFGDFLCISAALALAIIVHDTGKKCLMGMLVLLVATLLLGIFLSQSFGVWLGFAVITVLVGTLGHKKGFMVMTVIAVLGFLAFFFFTPKDLHGKGEGKLFGRMCRLASGSVKKRWQYDWPSATEMVKARPILGYGLNAYRDVYEDQHGIERPHLSRISSEKERAKAQSLYLSKMRQNVHPHNELLQAWTSMGIGGVFFYGALFTTVLLTYITTRRLKVSKFTAAMSLGVFVWYMGHTAIGVFHCFFFSARTFACAAIMFALMFGTLYIERDRMVVEDVNAPDKENEKPSTAAED
jgi:O-antigen ligase